MPDADLARQREVVDAFFAAARGGDFDALVAVLDPDVVLRADGGAGRAATVLIRGAAAVAGQALMFAEPVAVRPAGARQRRRRAWSSRRRAAPSSVMGFTVRGGKIVEIDAIADPERLAQLDLTV